VRLTNAHLKTNTMKTLNELQKELQDLKIAYSNKYLNTNEYCVRYLTISNKIKYGIYLKN
jgi:hypothetical protein